MSLKVPYSEGEPFGDSSQTPPASLEVPEAPAQRFLPRQPMAQSFLTDGPGWRIFGARA